MTVTVSQQAQYQGPTVTSQKVFHKKKMPIVRRYLRRNLVILTKIKNKLRNKRLRRNRIYEKLNFYFFEMLIQNTHLKFKAYIAQTIEKFLYKKGTSSLSRRFKAQQPVILPTVSHDSQHELEKHF